MKLGQLHNGARRNNSRPGNGKTRNSKRVSDSGIIPQPTAVVDRGGRQPMPMMALPRPQTQPEEAPRYSTPQIGISPHDNCTVLLISKLSLSGGGGVFHRGKSELDVGMARPRWECCTRQNGAKWNTQKS